MPERAHLTSLEALESFRAALIVYQGKTRPTLEEATSEIQRMRTWLEDEHRLHLEQQRRRLSARLDQARQALSNARISHPGGAPDDELMAVRRAQRAVEEVELKIRRTKQWSRDFDSRVAPLAKQLEQLIHVLTSDLPQAAAHLAHLIRTLSDYAGPTAGSPPQPGTSTAEAPEAGPPDPGQSAPGTRSEAAS